MQQKRSPCSSGRLEIKTFQTKKKVADFLSKSATFFGAGGGIVQASPAARLHVTPLGSNPFTYLQPSKKHPSGCFFDGAGGGIRTHVPIAG